MFTDILKDIARNNGTKVEEIKNDFSDSITYFFPKYTEKLYEEIRNEVDRYNSIIMADNEPKSLYLDFRSDLNYISVEVR